MYQTPLSEEDKEEIKRKLQNSEFSPEEFEEIIPLLPELGLSGQIFGFDSSDNPQAQMATDYIKYHSKLPADYEKLPVEEIKEKGRLLLDPLFNDLENRKEIIILLAHHGSIEALEILQNYFEIAQAEELKFWTFLAIDECKAFLESDIMERPVTRITEL